MSRIFLITLAALALASLAGAGPVPQKSVENGIALELSVQPVSDNGPLREAQDVRVTLKVTDQLTGSPVTNLYPAGWMDRAAVRRKLGEEVPADCKKKVESFLGGSMLSRPEVDLNVYYVLALNEDASISVVDPLFGYGNSRLLSMVFLASPGEDWVLSADGKRLFVSMPEAGRVAVVDTSTWKVTGEVEAGPHPRRLGLQPDGQYLWVTTDAGVVAIGARDSRPEKAASIPTGAGGHDLAFSDDSRFAFVTNEVDGTVAVIDVAKLAVARKLPVGRTRSRLPGPARLRPPTCRAPETVPSPRSTAPARSRGPASPRRRASARSASPPAAGWRSWSIPKPTPCTSSTRPATGWSRRRTWTRTPTRWPSPTSSPTSATAAAKRS